MRKSIDKRAPSILKLDAALRSLQLESDTPMIVAGEAAELGACFLELARAVSGAKVSTLIITDDQSLVLRREDFASHAELYARAFEVFKPRPISVRFF